MPDNILESAAILLVSSILVGLTVPRLQPHIEMAQVLRAQADVRAQTVGMMRLLNDVHVIRSLQSGHLEHPALLVTNGTIPAALDRAAARWIAPADGRDVDALAAHLLDNTAAYPETAGAFGVWQGPYIDALSPDPWGSRYAVNVGMLSGGVGAITIVLSAGPNKIVETPFAVKDPLPAGDDIVGLVHTRH